MDRKKVHPTPLWDNNEDFMISANEHERFNSITERNQASMQIQLASRFYVSKNQSSKFNSDINVSPYSVIEREKLNYLYNFSRFEQMRLVENLASCKNLYGKVLSPRKKNFYYQMNSRRYLTIFVNTFQQLKPSYWGSILMILILTSDSRRGQKRSQKQSTRI